MILYGDKELKEATIESLILLDVSLYRCKGLSEKPSRYKHEPPMFRNDLRKVYETMDINTLQHLFNIKNR